MSNPVMIPDEVVEAAARAIRQWLAHHLDKATPASELTDGEHEEIARAALAAGLAAWPEIVEARSVKQLFPNCIVLPLPEVTYDRP